MTKEKNEWDAQANIEILSGDAEHLEHLIAEYGENRSLGNVLQNVKSRLKWWIEFYKNNHTYEDTKNPEPLDMKDM